MGYKEGDRVRIITRPVTAEDRKSERYFEHMAGLVGTIQAIYNDESVAIHIDNESVVDPAKTVYKNAEARLQQKFAQNATEEMKMKLTDEELAFGIHHIVLARAADLEKASS